MSFIQATVCLERNICAFRKILRYFREMSIQYFVVHSLLAVFFKTSASDNSFDE
jgi:hypothetical protein